MGTGSNTPAGPDLRQGVRLDDVAENVPFAGQVDGESAILVRRGEEVFALGATCTHYSCPLAEGLVTGQLFGTVDLLEPLVGVPDLREIQPKHEPLNIPFSKVPEEFAVGANTLHKAFICRSASPA